jgi:hypothetical protein
VPSPPNPFDSPPLFFLSFRSEAKESAVALAVALVVDFAVALAFLVVILEEDLLLHLLLLLLPGNPGLQPWASGASQESGL